jgi:hypothetical protein
MKKKLIFKFIVYDFLLIIGFLSVIMGLFQYSIPLMLNVIGMFLILCGYALSTKAIKDRNTKKQ